MLFFVTLRGKKFPTVSRVRDHLRKVSKKYCIVREKDTTNGGYHFHALADMTKKPHRGWFPKGNHVNLQRIGGEPKMEGGLPLRISHKDIDEHCPLAEAREEHSILREEDAERRRRKEWYLDGHVGRVKKYMVKEYKPEWVRYEDYLECGIQLIN